MKTWNVTVPRLQNGQLVSVHIGTVDESTESYARCAALSKFGASEDEYFEAIERGEEQPKCISPADDFEVTPA